MKLIRARDLKVGQIMLTAQGHGVESFKQIIKIEPLELDVIELHFAGTAKPEYINSAVQCGVQE